MPDEAQLVVDEGFFLLMTGILAELETGEERFEVTTAAHRAVLDETLAQMFRERTGSHFSPEARHAVTNYVAGLYVPGHYNLYFEGIPQSLSELDEAVANGVRLIVWSFMTAWTQRFGGLHTDLRMSGTLVDPGARDSTTARPDDLS